MIFRISGFEHFGIWVLILSILGEARSGGMRCGMYRINEMYRIK